MKAAMKFAMKFSGFDFSFSDVPVLIRKCDAFVDFLQGQFTLDGGERQNFLKFLEVGENPVSPCNGCGALFFLAAVVFNKHLVLGNEDVFLQ